jgi:hypothetical protein
LLGRKGGGGNKNLHSYWRLKKKKLAGRKSIDAPKDYKLKRKHKFRKRAQREGARTPNPKLQSTWMNREK